MMFEMPSGVKLLAIEAATDVCSVAACNNGQVYVRHELAPRRHAELALAYCHAVLHEAQLSLSELDALVVGRGPGSFTGVRIAIAVAQGLAYGADLPVAPVSTLATLAQSVFRARGHVAVCAALDARMHETYCGAFRVDLTGQMVAVSQERVCPMSELELPQGEWFGAGPAWQQYAEQIPDPVARQVAGTWADAQPHAADALVLGLAQANAGTLIGVSELEPVYLRNRVTR